MIKRPDPKVDFTEIEHRILNFWEKNQIFQKRRKLNKGFVSQAEVDVELNKLPDVEGAGEWFDPSELPDDDLAVTDEEAPSEEASEEATDVE